MKQKIVIFVAAFLGQLPLYAAPKQELETAREHFLSLEQDKRTLQNNLKNWQKPLRQLVEARGIMV